MEILYGAKNGVHAFGYNFAESEPIWMTSGAPWVQILGVIRAVSTVSETAEILFFFQVNNARFHPFPVRQILRRLNKTTSVGVAM